MKLCVSIVCLVSGIQLANGQSTTPPPTPAKPASAPVSKPATPPKQADAAKEIKFTFDKGDRCTPGKVPTDWQAEGTNQSGPIATWEVIADSTAPSSPNVLALSKTNHDSPGTYNICWTDAIHFKDGAIEVKFKAVSGKEDQGGGLIWRVKDKDNYMVARMNPLEDNFRVYYVKDGSRHQIESAKVVVKADEWHTMKIEQDGNHIICSLDGKEYLDIKDDHIQNEGGIGVWTKSDAVTSFDDLRVQLNDEKKDAQSVNDKKKDEPKR